jgi:hypothetical protein
MGISHLSEMEKRVEFLLWEKAEIQIKNEKPRKKKNQKKTIKIEENSQEGSQKGKEEVRSEEETLEVVHVKKKEKPRNLILEASNQTRKMVENLEEISAVSLGEKRNSGVSTTFITQQNINCEASDWVVGKKKRKMG